MKLSNLLVAWLYKGMSFEGAVHAFKVISSGLNADGPGDGFDHEPRGVGHRASGGGHVEPRDAGARLGRSSFHPERYAINHCFELVGY